MKNPANNILYPEGVGDYLKSVRLQPSVNIQAHSQLHTPGRILWTGPATISTTAGSRLYPDEGGRIISALMSVDGAPSSTLTWALLKNGTSVFNTNPTILSGSNYSSFTNWVENNEFIFGDYFQFQVTTTGGATGPAHGLIRYVPVGF